MSTSSVSKENDNDDDSFVLPTAMLAPTHLWASSSSSDDDDEHDQTSVNTGDKSSKKKKNNNYLAPFVATPSADALRLIHGLLKNSFLGVADDPNRKTFNVCDIGCGDGSFILEVGNQALLNQKATMIEKVSVNGFDIDEEVIDKAKENATKYPGVSSSTFVVADVCKLLCDNSESNNNSSNQLWRLLKSLNGVYIYLFPTAMKEIEPFLVQLIDSYDFNNNSNDISLQWIVTRRWKFFADEEDETGAKSGLNLRIKLIDVLYGDGKEGDRESSAPFFVYGVV